MPDELFIALEIVGYSFVSCFCVGVVVCTARSVKICYNKYVLNLPDNENVVNATVSVVPVELANAIIVDDLPTTDDIIIASELGNSYAQALNYSLTDNRRIMV